MESLQRLVEERLINTMHHPIESELKTHKQRR